MKTSIILTLDTRRKKKDGTCPLIFRLSHQRKTTSISTGFSFSPIYWNQKNRTVKKSYKGVGSVSRLNNLLSKKKTEFADQINKLEENDKLRFMSILQVKEHICKTTSTLNFFEYSLKLIDEFKKAKKFGTAKNYRGAYLAFKKYHNSEHLRFEEINYTFLKGFETYHYKKGTTTNGLSAYLRTVRSIFNKAIKEKIVGKEAYPFDEYKIKNAPTAKRAVSKDKIKRILGLEFPPESPLFHARNYFLVSYLMNGMNFTDMAYLKRKNILDGRIKYRRQKTSKLYDLKITDQLQEFLSHYIKDQKKEDYIFPILKRKTAELQYKDLQTARSNYNDQLKEIAQKCDIEENLTSYVSRHSMATHLILSDVPINALSKMLGHSNLKTTQIYIKDLPTNILDGYQERLTL